VLERKKYDATPKLLRLFPYTKGQRQTENGSAPIYWVCIIFTVSSVVQSPFAM
jgi:hypothetical protein